jgi:serine/threonine-protein kinase
VKERPGDGSAPGADPDATAECPISEGLLARFRPGGDDPEATTAEDPGRYVFRGGDRDAAEIGRGGIGRVLLAFDRHLRREVALKELRNTAASERQLTRFLREARVTGQLEHPGVVPVHELGHRPDGTLYYAMRLVRGRTLRDALDDCADLEARLRLLPHFVDLCQTIAYAHSRGVIHRDIKPDNVMIGEFGETVVLDWGLARPLQAAPAAPAMESSGSAPIFEGTAGGTDAGLTVAGSFLGTPSYVSPEQALGDPAALDGCADIWSLGAVLHELLTGRPPFTDDTLQGLLVRVLADPVRPPHLVDPEIPADLSSICVKALERNRAVRYRSAREVAEEIEAFRSGRRVRAHEYTPWEHLVRFAVQKKGLLAAAGGVLAVVVIALVLVSLSLGAEKVAREEAEIAREEAETARAEERRERLRAGLHFAQGAAEKAGRLFAERRLLSARIYAAAALVHNPAHPAKRASASGWPDPWPRSGCGG